MGNPPRDESAEEADTGDGGLGSSRRAQLQRDLRLTPEQRVRAAEETLKLERLRAVHTPHLVIGFDRYEDYLDYKWTSSTRGA